MCGGVGAAVSELRDLLSKLAAVDRSAAVWCAAQCARVALHLVDDPRARPREALEMAEKWVRGRTSTVLCCAAAARAQAYARRLSPSAAHSAAQSAAFAANCPRQPLPAMTAERAARALHEAYGDPAPRHLDALLARVRSIRWPFARATPALLATTSPGVAVAYDWLEDDPQAAPDQSIEDLLAAHARAARLGLFWPDPVQRSIAERTVDEAHISRLLSSDNRPRRWVRLV